MNKEDIKYAVISVEVEDGKPFLVMPLRYDQAPDDDTTKPAMALFPYGMEANAPVGSLVALFSVKGQEENAFGIPTFPQERFGDHEPWEVSVGNLLSRCRIKFLNSGDIEITATRDMNGEIERDVTLNIGEKITINAKSVEVNCEDAVVNSDSIDLAGTGGAGLARIGDLVDVTSGSSLGQYPIITGSAKVRSN